MRLLIIGLTLATFTYATASEQTMSTEDKYKYFGGNEAVRAKKDYQITAQPVGFGSESLFSAGLNAGVFLDANSMLQLEYMHGQTEGFFKEMDVEVDSYGIHYKRFVTNSFYWNVGLDYRRFQAWNSQWYSLNVTSYGKKLGETEILAAAATVGNQWQFSAFTLGCDWIGFQAKIVQLSRQFDNNAADDDGDRNEYDDFTDQVQVNFARLYLGTSF